MSMADDNRTKWIDDSDKYEYPNEFNGCLAYFMVKFKDGSHLLSVGGSKTEFRHATSEMTGIAGHYMSDSKPYSWYLI
jgi:hypothetical protein